MNYRVTIAASMVSLLASYGLAIAQETNTPRRDVNDAQVTTDVQKETDQKAHSLVMRASKIDDMKVRNSAGKDIGSVKDVVIDVEAGHVKYAALSYGGFLGVGDKLFAVPWDAFTHKYDANDEEHFLTLDVDEATLKKAPGFDQDKWPNFADAQFSSRIDKHYDKFRHSTSAANRSDDTDGAVRNDTPAADQSASLSNDRIHRASKIMDMEVRNQAGTKLGEVDDLVIDMNTGKVRYAALSYGGFLGLGDKLFAVPWSAFKAKYDTADEEHFMVVNLAEATLRKGTGFNKDAWPNFADPKITSEIDKHYGVEDRSDRDVKDADAVRN